MHYSQGETLRQTFSIHKNSEVNRDQYSNLDSNEEKYQTKQHNNVTNVQQLCMCFHTQNNASVTLFKLSGAGIA